MSLLNGPVIEKLENILKESRPFKDAFLSATESVRQKHMRFIIGKRDVYLDTFMSSAEDDDMGQNLSTVVLKEVKAYANRCNWNFIDIVFLMACVDNLDETVLEKVARLSLLYQALRMIDDLIDDHLYYKEEFITLYGVLKSNPQTSARALSGSILPALLMICEGLRNSTDKYFSLTIKTVCGALREIDDVKSITLTKYNKIVEGKMISYGMLLYGPVLDAMGRTSEQTMKSFLRKSFLFSQIANDLIDREDDLKRGQPNFWNIFSRIEDAADYYLAQLLEIYISLHDFPAELKPYAYTRLYDIMNYVVQGWRKTG